jgi:hypothetical protein
MVGQWDIQMPRSSGLTMFKFALPKGAGPLSKLDRTGKTGSGGIFLGAHLISRWKWPK